MPRLRGTVLLACLHRANVLQNQNSDSATKHKKIHTLKAFTSPSFEAVPQFLRPQALSSSLQW